MEETISIYANEDLRTLERGNNNLETLDMPDDELTGAFQFIVDRQQFLDAYKNWDHDAKPLLTLFDQLSRADIYLGKPSAERVHQAIEKKQAGVQLR